MPVLTHANLLPIFLVFMFTLGAGFMLKSAIRSSGEFLQDLRGLSAGIAVPAFCATFLGAPEVLGLGALGACNGWRWSVAFVLGLIPALLIACRWSAPRLVRAQAKTVAEFLGQRYGRSMRTASAILYVLFYLLGAAIALGLLAHTVQMLHILDGVARERGWPVESIYPGVVTTSAMMVLLAVLWGGFAGSVYSRAIQFCFLLVGFLPLSMRGVESVGGWSGLQSSTAGFSGVLAQPLVAWLLGAAIGAGVGSADFRLLQILLNCRKSALRRVPLLALLPLLAASLLVVLPGAVAPLLPTPRTAVTQSVIEGAIVRTTTVARPEEEAGRGLTPAQTDPATGNVQHGADGAVRLEYAMGALQLAVKELRAQALGLVLAALLAALLSGVTAQLTAITALLNHDLLPLFFKLPTSDEALLRILRWTAAGTMAAVAALALVLRSHGPGNTQLLLLDGLCGMFFLALMALGMAAVRVPEQKAVSKRKRQGKSV
ncbi:sodium:solute symporter family transporter [Telmatobacter bradus]|uniref:sodium:solute symporter family transporter n=1 Tax=Telmatobacter bradus TaxID=474953 RepID=UPI003B427AC6